MMSSWFSIEDPHRLVKFSIPPNSKGETNIYALYFNDDLKAGDQPEYVFTKPDFCDGKCTWKPPHGKQRLYEIFIDERYM